MSYYQKHIFFCTNIKDEGKKCCSQGNAVEMLHYAKKKLKHLGLHGEGKIRLSSSGCLGRCALGPVLVIYPDGVWYTYHSESDIDEIIESNLTKGVPVKRLMLLE